MRIIVSVLLACLSISLFAVTITSKLNGNWTSTSTWDLGRLPANGDTIVINHAVEVPNNNTITLNGVTFFVSVSLKIVNQAEIVLDSASTFTLDTNATLERSTGNGELTIGGTSLMSSGSGVQKTGAATGTYNGWGGYIGGLPVIFVDLQIEKQLEGILINWATVSEINNDYFVVEKMNGLNWGQLGTVDGAGTTNVPRYYQFLERMEEVTSSENYYRIKQVDFDGNFSYSSVISYIIPKNEQLTTNSSIDFGGVTKVMFPSQYFSNGLLNILNLNGVIVQNVKLQPESNYVDVSILKNGIYILHVENEFGFAVKKVSVLSP